MKIAIDCGHTLSGADRGASGIGGREEVRTREIGKALNDLLVRQGHSIVDCTLDNANSVGESLAYRVDKANNSNVDIYVAIHLNAYNGEARGIETHVYNNCSNVSLDYAHKVQQELCKLGYIDRGVKKGNLYVVKNTNAPAILVECGFIDNQSDMNLYNANNIAKAICCGIIGNTSTSNNAAAKVTNTDNWVSRLQKELNAQGFGNLALDGIPGPLTLGACPTVKQGANGNITKLIQDKLGITADGIFGPNTKKAVESFQSRNGLVADGIAGQNTWRKLLGL